MCQNVIEESAKTFANTRKPILKKVEVDLDLMVKAHKKIVRGELVEQEVVSNLLLGGIINILHQHDTVEELDRRIKSLEEMMLTDKLRIELLENWIQNQAEEIKKIGEKSTEDSLENLIGKIDAVETDLKSYREQINVES